MILNIPKWPEDSDVDHTKTSWKLAKDVDFEDIVEEIDESEEELLAWSVDTIIPTGEIWYVKALRKLEDEDGNDLNNTSWIGPKPIFSEESSVNDYLAPKFYINRPYINDIKYVENETLTIDITPFKSNVGYVNTLLSVEDRNGHVLFTKFYDAVADNYSLVVTDEELDLSELDVIRVSVLHNGTQSTTSAPVTELISIKNAFFNVIGNRKELDFTYQHTLKVVSTTYVGVTLQKALLKDRSGTLVQDCSINNNILTIEATLDKRSEYLLELTVEYTDSDGNKQTTVKVLAITTRDTDEVIYQINNRVYDKTFSMQKRFKYHDGYYKYSLEKSFNTEELFTYSVPMLDLDNEDISLFGINKREQIFSRHLEHAMDITTGFTFRLLTKTKGILQRTIDGVIVINIVSFDPYTDEFLLGDDIETNLAGVTDVSNKIVQLPTGTFLVGINKDSATTLEVYSVGVDEGVLTLLHSYTVSDPCTDVSVSELGTEHILMIPKSEDFYRTLRYSTIENYTNNSVVIPGEFRNIDLMVNKLHNGDVVAFKHMGEEDSFNFFIYDKDAESTEVIEVDNGASDKVLTNIVPLKSGDILSICKNVEVDTEYAEFWLMK